MKGCDQSPWSKDDTTPHSHALYKAPTRMMNITGLVHNPDPTFRYRMPSIQTKIEGRGNGIRTVVSNITDVADALDRPPELILRFFGFELGTQATWEDGADTEPKGHVNGVHTPASLQSALARFQELLVLCSKCRLPETILGVRKGVVRQTCAACGLRAPVGEHRILTRIQHMAAVALTSASKRSTTEAS